MGGATYAWGSLPIIGMGVLAAVCLAGFVAVERRAAEPVIPLRLFTNRVFSSTSVIGFAVGFAMFGALAYLPQYMQVVRGTSPTSSGLRLLPMMAGLLLTSIGTGQLVSRWGRYKIFPIVGTALMTFGLFLLSRMGVGTDYWLVSLYLFVLGVGIGASMQVLVIAVQNAVDYKDLGAGTSGATFFRSIGGSFGTAIFGAIFANVLVGDLASALHGVSLPAGISASSGASPAVLDHLPAVIKSGYISGYAQALHSVFLVAVPIGALAFCLTFLLKELPLRETTRAVDRADSTAPTAVPATRNSAQEMERALLTLFGREHRAEVYRGLAEAAGLSLSPRGTWLLYRVSDLAPVTVPGLADRLDINRTELADRMTELLAAGYVTASANGESAANGSRGDGALGNGARGDDSARSSDVLNGQLTLTPAGADAAARLGEAREAGIDRLMTGWEPDQNTELRQLIGRITTNLVATDQPPERDPAPAPATATA
ncbi:MAG: MFS transporter [Actinomycetota bacterium]